MRNLSVISRRFADFAKMECEGSCGLYAYVSRQIAADDDLLDLAASARENQPIPNLFFGAVHYLLLQGVDHELKQFYGSVVDFPKDAAEVFSYFKDFCQKDKAEIITILQSKFVKTNEVRRCSYLYPVFLSKSAKAIGVN